MTIQKEETKKSTTEAGHSSLDKFIHKFYETYTPTFIIDDNGGIYMTIYSEGRSKTLKIEKNSCETFLVMTLRKFGMGGARNKETAQRIIDELEALAMEKGQKGKVFIRYGRSGDTIYVDLGNASTGNIVKIDPSEGISISQGAPIPLWLSPNLTPLPLPKQISAIDFIKLWNSLFDFEEAHGPYLLLVFAIKALIPESGTCPILVFEGPQGSGKTTATTIIKKLIDPSFPVLLSPPNSEETVAITASLVHLLAYDNISHMSNDMADVICRLSTGGGLGKRKLYTNGDLSAFNYKKSVLFNGIEEISPRPDFMDRALILHLKPFNGDKLLIAETAYWEEFEAKYPLLLWGLYELTSKVMQELPSITKVGLPRLSDFVRVGLALDKIMGQPEGHFRRVFDEQNEAKVSHLFDSDMFCQRIQCLLDLHPNIVESPTAMLKKIIGSDRSQANGMPRNPRQLRGALARNRAVLNANGIDFGYLPRKANKREMYLKKTNFIEDDGELLI